MKISYAIPVCNEHVELKKLLSFLISHVAEGDEIVVQCDEGNTTLEVYKVLNKYADRVKVIEFPLKGHFSNFKNNLNEHCTGDWIFQIDADELPNEYLIQTLPHILEANDDVEAYWVPRINTVAGITDAHIAKWGWKLNKDGWVNFPDWQMRIYCNSYDISWINPVHEQLKGYTNFVNLPAEEKFCLYHPKDIGRQEKQNAFYETI